MMGDDLLSQLLERACSPVAEDRVVTADEAAAWPEGTLDSLLHDGVLVEIQPATSVQCDACFEGHVEMVEFVEEPPGSPPRAYIACPETGRVAVDPQRMRRWQIQSTMPYSDDGEGGVAELPFVCSNDYTSVRLYGKRFLLAPRQAAVVEMLHHAHGSGAPELHWRQIKERLASLDYYPARMRDVFRNSPEWRSLVVSSGKGFYRLNL